jgi:hypothetical protein
MNTRTLLAATVLALGASAAMAESPTVDTTPFQATRTRAEVKADVLVAAATRSLQPAGEAEAAPSLVPVYSVARADVKAEVLSARAAGTLLAAGELIDGPRTTPARTLSLTRFAGR